jgi:hypothetical protein
MSLTTDQKDACLQAARRYVSAGDPRNDEWFGTTSWPYGAVAGYQALVILLQLDPEFVDSLGPEPWARWIPVLMTLLREGTGQYADDLVRRAYTANPSEFLKQLRARVRTEAKDSLYVSVVSNIEHVWDSAIESALCDVLEDKSLQGTAIGSLLRPLLYHKSAVALEFALSLLQGPASDRGKSEFAIAAAGVLIDVSPKEAWETLWPTLLEDDEFGKRIIEQTSYRNFGNTPLLTALTERELAQLFRWMLKQYPLRQNEGLGFGAVSPAFAATRLRDSLVQRLATYGSYEALEVLKTLQTELPNFPWVYYLAQADERAREATWQPPRPKDVVELARRSEARLVNNADQLMSVVKDALKRIQLQLRAETPAVEELWNHTLAKKGEKRRWTPKDELYLSNWLKRRLQEVIQVPGIMIGREVEIRSFVSSLGERTDLYIAAAKPGGKDKLVLVVEVKGCWHHELKTAMQTQLVERYLKENFYGHGIYVVGWFACALWDAGDYRRKDVGFSTSDEARAHLDQQAADLSNDEVRVAAFVLDATLR